MNCRKARKAFDALLHKGEGPRGVADHLRGCASCAEVFRRWEAMVRALQSAPARQATPGLKARILRAVATEGRRAAEPRPVFSLRPPGALQWAFSAAVVLALAAGGWWLLRDAISGKPARTDGARILTLNVTVPAARSVAVAGDFNGWDAGSHLLKRRGADRWTITLPLRPGVYEYLLLVDGEKWLLDPENPVRIPDGFGGFNSGVEL
jgi:hypothetical protein